MDYRRFLNRPSYSMQFSLVINGCNSVELLVISANWLDSVVQLLQVNSLRWVSRHHLLYCVLHFRSLFASRRLHHLLAASPLLCHLPCIFALPLLSLLLFNCMFLLLLVLHLHLLLQSLRLLGDQGVPLFAVLWVISIDWAQLNHEIVGVFLVVGLYVSHILHVIIHLDKSSNNAASKLHPVGFQLSELD